MSLSDYHIHTQYSGDIKPGKGMSVDTLCRRAIELGFGEVAITDHFDIDGIADGYFPPLDFDSIKADVFAAKEKYADKLNVIYGLELGQAIHMPNESNDVLKKYPFEFVIGSVHAVRGIIDFGFVGKDYSDERLNKLWEMYLSEMKELIAWGNFDTLAHITYPLRYYKRIGKDALLELDTRKREFFEDILKSIIQKSIALEVNTSGVRQGLGITLPDRDLIEFYYQLGGEYITVGSDAHFECDLGADILQTYRMLEDIGFKYITHFKNRKAVQVKIQEAIQ